MRLFSKIFLSVFVYFLVSQAMASEQDYVSVFKPVQTNKRMSELQKDIRKDFFQVRSLMNFQEKEFVGLVEDDSGIEIIRTPSEI